MNRIHRTVWNPRRGEYMVAAETTRSRGKASGANGALLAGVLMGAVGAAMPVYAAGPAAAALPTGAQVTAGQAQIATAGSTLTVTQGSAKAAINWGTFSIGKDATVNFVQPNASAIALNRVTGTEGSVIDGALSANGQVFILNPNGVLFGKGARVDTAGLVATTLGLSDADFLAGKTGFTGHGGAVVNQGSLTAKDGGYIALIGQQVKNDGTITARLGTVALAAGDKVSLNFNGNALVGVAIDQGALDALVANGGAIRADGGLVVLTAQGAEGLVNTLVNNTGEIRAQTVESKAGRIYLLGEGGKVEVAGTLDASAPAGNGGFIETSGANVHIADTTSITTAAAHGASGTWLIDPTDFTIAASGGDITGATLSSNLASGSVTILSSNGATGTSGDINVNDAVSWSSGTRLTLNAARNIKVAATIDASAGLGGVLEFDYGQAAVASANAATYSFGLGPNGFAGKVNLQAGNNFVTKLGSDGTPTTWTVITLLGSAGDKTVSASNSLQGLGLNYSSMLSGNFVLGADIDASATAGWNAGAGFAPIGDSFSNSSSTQFTGGFDGLGHVVSGLFINLPSNNVGVGMFGILYGSAVVRNVGVTGATVTGGPTFTGALAGQNFGTVRNTYSSGTITGVTKVGGLMGNTVGTLADSHSSSTVSGTLFVGGLVGYEYAPGTVSGTYATGNVSGTQYVGGLIGLTFPGSFLSDSHATGDVTATLGPLGGLIGQNYATLTNSSASGNVTGTGTQIGGLIGMNVGPVSNSFSTGNVTGTGTQIGGLIGAWSDASQLTNSFYNLDAVVVTANGANQSAQVTLGGLYGAQYTAWQSGGRVALNASTYLGAADSNAYYSLGSIQNLKDLLAFSSVAGLKFKLVGDLDLSSIAGWHIPYLAGALSGGGHALLNLSNNQIYNDFQGLIGYNVGAVQSLSISGSVAGLNNVGGLAGSNSAVLSNTSSSATVQSGDNASNIGGLVGSDLPGSRVTQSHATGSVTTGLSASYVGGLVGKAVQTGSTAGIDTDYATGNLSVGASSIGGIGGLVGYADGVTVNQSFASGNVTVNGAGAQYVGGLVGEIIPMTTNAGGITNSYATGAVTVGTGAIYVGGLLGYDFQRPVTKTYATGLITVGSGATSVGGLVGARYQGSVTGSFWATDATSRSTSPGGGVGMTLAQIKQSANFSSATSANGNSNPGWSFSTTWFSYDGLTAPLLRAFLTPLTIAVNPSKTYDATVTGNVLSYSVSPDPSHLLGTLSISGPGRNVGTYAVTPSGAWSDQLGYLLTYVPGSITVTPAPLTISATGSTQVYNGSTVAQGVTVTGTPLGSDALTFTSTGATLASKNAGTEVVTVSGLAFSGADAGNYALQNTTATTTSLVTPAPLAVTAAGGTQTYNGSTAAQVTLSAVPIGSDQITVIAASATLDTKNVGVNKPVSVTGITIAGADGGNYMAVNTSAATTANVTAAPLVVTAVGGSQVYNGSTAATVTLGGGFVGDQLTFSDTSAVLADKNVGTNKAVSVSGIAVTGADAGNYVLTNTTASTTTNVMPATLTVSATGGTQVYNGSTAASVTLASNALNGDTVSLANASASLADKNVGTNKAVSVTGIAVTGADAGNYVLANTTASTTTNVMPATLTVSATGGTQVYNGTTAATVTLGSNAFSGDVVSLSDASATLADKNVGSNKAVSVTGIAVSGTDAGNYVLANTTASTTVAITPRTLNLSFTVADKTFDGSTTASATAADNRVSGDQLSAQFSAAYADTNAGAAKPVAITGLALTGADAANYQVASNAGSGVTGNMLTRSVTYTLAAQDPSKTYTATGQVLVSAAALDQLVVASFANSVAGTSPGALSYTIYKNGQQVNAITDAGSYEIRASFAAADPHYALASTGNSTATIVVAAAAAVTPPPTAGTTPPATSTPPATASTPPASTTVGPVAEVVAQAVRTEVPVSTAAVVASAGIGVPRSLVDFSAMPPNVATSPAALTAAFGAGVPLSLLSSPSGAEPSQAVTLAQASQMITTSSDNAEPDRRDVRVPVSRNSLAQIVNGGVRLPGGVDQLLFVVKADK